MFKSIQNLFFFYLIVFVILICYLKEQKINSFFYFLIFIFSGLFLIRNNLILLFLNFEASLIGVLFLLLLFGTQIEKIKASSYFVFYSVFFAVPFLVVVFISNLVFLDLNFKIKISLFLFYIFRIIFLIKIPLFGLHF